MKEEIKMEGMSQEAMDQMYEELAKQYEENERNIFIGDIEEVF